MTFYGLAIFVFSIAFTNLVKACPVGQLAALSKETLGELRKEELPAGDNDSTEGGQWQIFIRDDASLHSIIRLDFGETGQRQIRLSRLNRREFAITLNNLRYDIPLNANDRVDTDTANKISKVYFFL
ncbi:MULTISPECIES: hypothetical protein [Rhodomicrobium]|uniref:hypothetical protein n=1 Tax=Rhodomicrobium TaxID=1068 RepID=UPI000F73A17B|nr:MULTISPECIES: hypothetical protein [Rhodomicrobium]